MAITAAVELAPRTRDERMCLHKVAFRSYNYAKRIAGRVSYDDDEPVRPYHCPVCGLWHIGHDPATTRRLIGFRYGADSHS